MINLTGKVAVVTGGSRGIGKASVIALAGAGADVAIVCSSNIQKAAELCADVISEFGVKAQAYICDVSDYNKSEETCKQIFADFKKIDILVNNAGITKDNLFLRMKEEDFDSVIAVNLKGTFNFIRHLSRYIMKSDAGRIINISSVAGLMGNVGQINYASSKAGVIGMTKTVAKELASKKVTCNAIAPGFISTDMTENLPDKVKEAVNDIVPLKRMGTSEEIANLVLFLSSSMSSYITGEVIRADGGMCM